MSNEVITRIYLNGSAAEIKRLTALCIVEDEDEIDGMFNFEALVPPPEDPEFTQDWAMENWGCKWGSSGTRDHGFTDDVFDFSFGTPNTAPVGVLQALAEQFPTLTGDIEAGNSNEGWAMRGSIKDGKFSVDWRGMMDGEIASSLGLSWRDDDDDEDEEEDDDEAEYEDGDDAPDGPISLEDAAAALAYIGAGHCYPYDADIVARCGQLATDGFTAADVKPMLDKFADRPGCVWLIDQLTQVHQSCVAHLVSPETV